MIPQVAQSDGNYALHGIRRRAYRWPLRRQLACGTVYRADADRAEALVRETVQQARGLKPLARARERA